MENQPDQIWKNAMNYGAIGGLALVLFRFVSYVFDATFAGISILRMPILILFILIGTKYFRDKLQAGQIKYSRALVSGTLISLFSGIIFGFYVLVEFAYIDPNLMDEYLILQEEVMMKMPFLQDYQIEESINNMRATASPMKIGFSEIFSTTVWGFIFSLVISAFLKKENHFKDQMIINQDQQ